MQDASSSKKKSVLIVDRSEESREVLRTALQRRGHQILEADEARKGLRIAAQHHPQVIVLDLECDSANETDVKEGFDIQSQQQGSSLILLGNVQGFPTSAEQQQFISKPYHYAPLIHTIEKMLEGSFSESPAEPT